MRVTSKCKICIKKYSQGYTNKKPILQNFLPPKTKNHYLLRL